MVSQQFDIADEVLGVVGAEVGVRVAGEGQAASGSTLIEEDGAVGVGVEVLSCAGCGAGTWPAVEVESRYAVWVAAGFPIDLMSIAGVEHAGLVGLDGWVLGGHGGPFGRSESGDGKGLHL